MANGRPKCMVLVNATQESLEIVKAAAKTATRFSSEVYVISPLMASLMFATAEGRFRLSHPGQRVLIATYLNEFCEFYELEVVDPNNYQLINVQKCHRDSGNEMMHHRICEGSPDAVVILSTNDVSSIEARVEKYYDGIICVLIERLDFILLTGGLAKTAALSSSNFEPPMNVKDFANGFKIDYVDDRGKQRCRDLISFSAGLPAQSIVELTNIKSFSVSPQFWIKIIIYKYIYSCL